MANGRRIYLAGPWTRRHVMPNYAHRLEAAGHTITKKWWEHRDVPGHWTGTPTSNELKELVEQAYEDYDGVLDADVLVVMNFEKSEGKAVEQGIALAAGIPIIVVAEIPRTNVFQWMPDFVVVETFDEALPHISRL